MKGVHILGAGSIGTLFARHIAAAGVPCTLLLRSPAQLDVLQQLDNRVRVDVLTADGSFTSSQETVAAEVAAPLPLSSRNQPHDKVGSSDGSDQQKMSHIQQLILSTKANDAIPALAAVKHRLTRESVVVLLQNGVLGVYVQAVQEVFPHAAKRPAILLGSTTHGAYRKSPFHVVHGSSEQGTCVFGLPSQQLQAVAHSASGTAAAAASTASETRQQAERCRHADSTRPASVQLRPQQHLAANCHQQQDRQVQDMLSLLSLLQQLHPNTRLSPDELHQHLLLKLLVNCCANPLSALLHCKNGGLVDSPHTARLWRDIISECKQVFGDMLPGSNRELFERVHHVVKINSSNYNSMLQDVVQRRHTEVDYLNGFVVGQGGLKCVPTPVNETLTLLVKAREEAPHSLLTTEQL